MRKLRPAALAAALTLGLSALSAPAVAADPADLPPLVDVPEYRANSNRTSVYPGPGPVEEPVLVWSRTIDVPIAFNPILADGLLLFGGHDNIFYALDARTGAERWRFEAAGPFDMWGSAADDMVVVASGDSILHALDLATGEERWSRPGIGSGTSVVDGVVYAPGTDDHAYGLDLATGEVVWSWAAPAAVAYITVADGTAYTSVFDGRVYAVSIADGAEQWHVQTIAAVPRGAAVDGDTVFVSGGTWEQPVGELYVVDRDSGTVRWRFRTPTGFMITAGATADGVVYAETHDGSGLYAFPAVEGSSGAAPQPLWHTPLASSAFKNEALTGDLLYVPTDGPNEVVAVGAADGAIRWRLPVAAGPNGVLASGGMLFVSDQSGTIAAYAEPALAEAIGETASGRLNAPVATIEQPPNPFTVIGTLEPSTTTLHTLLAMDVGPDGLIYALDMKPSVTVIDPATGDVVRTWGRQGTGEGEFDLRVTDGNPGIGDIDVGSDGTVYVADGANHRLQAFTLDGAFLRQIGSFGSGDGQFSRPFGIAVDDEGSLYAVDHDLGTLTKFDRDGAFVWSAGGFGQRIALLPDGQIVWLRTDDGWVGTIDPATGAEVGRWGEPGLDPGQTGNPCDIAVDGAGNTYILHCGPDRTQVFDPGHRLIGGSYTPQDKAFVPTFGPNGEVYATDWGASDNIYVLENSLLGPPNPFTVTATLEPGTTGLAAITDLTVGPDGLIYVIDLSNRVSVIDPATGAPVLTWGGLGTGPGEFDFRTTDGNPGHGAIAVGADGRVYVGDGANHRYQVFEPDGTFIRQVGSFGQGDGQFSRIFHIAVDSDGNVYTVDHDLHVLSKFDPEGGFLWRVGGDGSSPPLSGILQSVVARRDGRLFQLVEDGPVIELDPSTGAIIDTWDAGPTGTLSFDSAGNAYGIDYVPSQVQVFDPDHRVIGGSYGADPKLFILIGPHDDAVGWWEGTDHIALVDVDIPGS